MQSEIIHSSCVVFENKAVLIVGASGSGKSGLALELMALGARLVADDKVILTCSDGKITARAPKNIRGKIEARFLGILSADAVDDARLACVVDLDTRETDRLPPWRDTKILGISLPLLHNSGTKSFPAAILQYLRSGRRD